MGHRARQRRPLTRRPRPPHRDARTALAGCAVALGGKIFIDQRNERWADARVSQTAVCEALDVR
jgi:hypothetical protein